MKSIRYQTVPRLPDARFSLVIPTWNNLAYLQRCIESIRKHSRFPHQIILHINEGADGTAEWVASQGLDYSRSKTNVGICFGVNAAASLASTDYIVYLNDDMVVCPDWDLHLWNEVERLGETPFFISSTLIEPEDTGNPCVIVGDFGDSVEKFREPDLLKGYASFEKEDQQCAGGCANLVPRYLWKMVGGYSVELSPGWNSDPDFCRKLWHAGVRYFKTVSKSRVYHFRSRSIRRLPKNKTGRRRFRTKWDLSSSRFMKCYLHLGQKFEGPLSDPKENCELIWSRIRGRLPALIG